MGPRLVFQPARRPPLADAVPPPVVVIYDVCNRPHVVSDKEVATELAYRLPFQMSCCTELDAASSAFSSLRTMERRFRSRDICATSAWPLLRGRVQWNTIPERRQLGKIKNPRPADFGFRVISLICFFIS